MSLLDLSGLIELDKFVASFITEMKKYQPVTCYNLPGCIKKALEDQGLKYEDGKIIKIQHSCSESEDERIITALIHFFSSSENTSFEYWEGISKKEVLDWLEKQGNPDKEYWRGYKDGKKAILDKYSETHKVVEPKFKVGDWIVTDKNHIWFIDEDCSTTGYSYRLISQNGKVEVGDYNIVDEHARLWTIQDAKDGDVLVDRFSKDNIIILYKGINPKLSILAYCGWNGYNLSIKTNGLGYGNLDNTNYSPATKEQCDLLFQKMKDSGYEWDAKNKELNKIHIIDEGKAEIDYCFTKMMNGEKVTPAWSEEDDMMLECVLDKIGDLGTGVMCKGWLKSLKNRIKGE